MSAIAAFPLGLLILTACAAHVVTFSRAAAELFVEIRPVRLLIPVRALARLLSLHSAPHRIVLLLTLTVRLLTAALTGLLITALLTTALTRLPVAAQLLAALLVALTVDPGVVIAAGGASFLLILFPRPELIPVACSLSSAPKLIVALLIRHLGLTFLEVRQGNG